MFALYYFTFVTAGTVLTYLYGRHTKRFLWREYIALCAAPILGVVGLSFRFGFTPIRMFLLGMLLLPTLEWFTGLAYHKVLGSPLWVYERYPLPGRYASYLTLPIWGAAMVLFWLIAKHI